MKQNVLNLVYAAVSFGVAVGAYMFGSGYESSGPGDMMGMFADIAFLSAPFLAVLGLWYLYRSLNSSEGTDSEKTDYCTECGAEIEGSETYCPECGNEVY